MTNSWSLRPNKAGPGSHNNSNIASMVSGSMTIMVDDKKVELRQRDICYIEPREKHMITGQDENLKCFLVKYPHLPDDKTICQK